jgi:hypothetical protein
VFDFEKIKNSSDLKSRYEKQIDRISGGGKWQTDNIESTVANCIENIKSECRSFVIYGEPQSGKTEMMISLSAKLIDEGFRIILILMNDSVDLLNQNLDRFKRSGIDPTPVNFTEILDKVNKIEGTTRIIFSKKNAKDLTKLIERVGQFDNKIVIDDEADYASPNSNINKKNNKKTKINELVETLIGPTGVYIGVTATPGALDLNNTFDNLSERWVPFQPHDLYVGQDVFFPDEKGTKSNELKPRFRPHLLPEEGDDTKWLKRALTNFLINVAYLNLEVNTEELNYSMLVHTSGKREDHGKDYQTITKIFNTLQTETADQIRLFEEIHTTAEKKYPSKGNDICAYIMKHKGRKWIGVLNSDNDKKTIDPTQATNPATLFTIVIGGNVVSRGVTFNNLLSMFFTRSTKHKMQQDTYIQRARMFGSRKKYLEYFELHIPEQLYLNWHRCFVFHRLSLKSIQSGNGAPVWLGDKKISSASKSRIDKVNVRLTDGEMSFGLFEYGQWVEDAFALGSSKITRIKNLSKIIGEESCPKFLITFIENMSPHDDESIVIYNTSYINDYKDGDPELIERRNGGNVRGDTAAEKLNRPHAVHYLKLFHNGAGKGKLFYRYRESANFLQNLKNDK